MRLRWTVLFVCVLGLAALGCDDEHDSPRQTLENALFDKLACQDVARPSTLARLREVLDHPDAAALQALLLAPEDLASIVAIGGPEAEAVVVVARNLFRVVDSGLGHELLTRGWQGVECGDPITLDCTGGSGTSQASCDDDGVPQAITLALDRCTLGGKVFDGTVLIDRSGDDAIIGVDGLGMNETTALSGTLEVALADDDHGTWNARLIEPLRVVDHGGVAGGLSCGEELDLDAFSITLGGDDHGDVGVALTGAQRTPKRSVGLETFDDDLRFDAGCGCPRPGSGLAFEVPRPLGHDDETAVAEVRWSAPDDARSCASVDVTLVGWPARCAGIDDNDCGQAAMEQTLASLLGAFCALP